jgi:hypothetical protein
LTNQYQPQSQQPSSNNWGQPQNQNQNQYPYQQPQQYQAPSQQQPSYNYQNQSPYSQQSQPQPQSQSQPNQYQQQQYINKPQYNSYSQPQQYQSVDQPDQYQQNVYRDQSLPQDYRGASPGIITLRKEAPVTQQPSPVYTSQPAAVSYRGGSNMRGDLKWPPQEYKEAAARENQERRQLALGPVCRPRKVNRVSSSVPREKDYTSFFAKNAINNYYPSYKVPPGTQHMMA